MRIAHYGSISITIGYILYVLNWIFNRLSLSLFNSLFGYIHVGTSLYQFEIRSLQILICQFFAKKKWNEKWNYLAINITSWSNSINSKTRNQVKWHRFLTFILEVFCEFKLEIQVFRSLSHSMEHSKCAYRFE